MTTYLLRNGELIEKHLAPPKHYARSAPGVISDVMSPLKHQGTGAVIDSKSEFRRHTRMSGCVEVGTDPAASRTQPGPMPTGVEMDVKRAFEELRSR